MLVPLATKVGELAIFSLWFDSSEVVVSCRDGNLKRLETGKVLALLYSKVT